MTRDYDAVIVGAGHNGLVCAAYLARAGKSVLVLERREMAGGCAVTEEFAPGFRCSATFPSAETFDPGIARELKLEDHGLRWLAPGGIFVPRLDGEALFLPAAGGTGPGTGVPPADAPAFAAFDAFLRRLADALAPIFSKPLPDLEPSGLADALRLLGTGWLLRRLGAEDLREAMRFLPMPIADVLDERFASDALKAAIGAGGLTGSWLAPRSPGSALNLLLHRLGACRGALGYPRTTAGGTGALIDALAKAAAAAGGAQIRTGAEVARILVEKGAAAGVALASGEELRARTVISNADPKTTLLGLVEPLHLAPSFLLAAKNVRARGTVAIVKLALDRLPAFSGAPEDPSHLAGRIQIGASLDELERAFDPAKYGRIPERPYLDLALPTVSDPDLAPAGRHVLSAWVQYPPYHLRHRSWAEAKDELGEIVVRRIEEHAPGFAASIQAREVLSPLDLEERFSVREGCLYHAEPALDQCLYMRPMPRWGRHRMPIDRLYLCGSGTHGGGGLTGLAGRNAARRLLSDRA